MKKQSGELARWNKLARGFLGDDFFESILESSKADKSSEEGPQVDVYHSTHEVIVVVAIPGIVDLRSIQFQVDEEKLIIHGVVPNPYHGYTSFSQKCAHGPFRKEIELGVPVEGEKKSIRYRHGILEIRFPKLHAN